MANFDGTMPHGLCAWCKHLQNIPERRCAAFSNGIPASIWLGKTKHDHPIEGDGGVLYELRTTPFDVEALGVLKPELASS